MSATTNTQIHNSTNIQPSKSWASIRSQNKCPQKLLHKYSNTQQHKYVDYHGTNVSFNNYIVAHKLSWMERFEIPIEKYHRGKLNIITTGQSWRLLWLTISKAWVWEWEGVELVMQSTKVFLIKSTDVFLIKNTIVFLIQSTKVFLLQSTTAFPSMAQNISSEKHLCF